MKKKSEILSVDVELGVPRSGHSTHIKIWPLLNRVLVIFRASGHPDMVIGGEIDIESLIEVLASLAKRDSD